SRTPFARSAPRLPNAPSSPLPSPASKPPAPPAPTPSATPPRPTPASICPPRAPDRQSRASPPSRSASEPDHCRIKPYMNKAPALALPRRRPPPGSASSRPARRGRADELGSLTYIRLACGRQGPGIACTCSPGQGRGGASWLAPVLTAGWALYQSLPGPYYGPVAPDPGSCTAKFVGCTAGPRSFFLLRPC